MPPRGVEQPIEQRLDDHALKAGANIVDVRVRQRLLPKPKLGTALRDVPQHRRLEAAEAEVARARYVRSIPIGMRDARLRKRDRAIVASGRPCVDDRAAGIAEAEQLRDLVVSLPCRVVPCAAEQLVAAG